ncbi:MAG: hypothetical protein IPM79_34720 [Polyangiaceae bacterium]|jgi:hypothetical protein|nr:hypothetical protein [Polyangiaceae bacterium]MBK8942612.1 hypothetical protein [Polyangiaceae bacterium]
MGSEPKASLRVQALKNRLLHHPNGERMFEYASTLDGWIHEWARYAARKDLPGEERSRALSMLSSMRRDFNALVAEADAYDPEPHSRRSAFGTALDELTDDEKLALSQILGVPYERQYRPLFEVKAAEYLEQDALWNQITEESGFVDTTTLLAEEAKSAVILTYSGSILLVSAPIEAKNFRRRYVYQSIYAGHLPTEGTLGLLEAIRKNRPVSGTRIKTSPVRKIRISREARPEWDRNKETFYRLHRTLNDAATPGALVLAPPSSPGAPAPLEARAPDAARPAPPRPEPAPGLDPVAGAARADGNTLVEGTPASVLAAKSDPPEATASKSAKILSSNRIPSVFVQVLHTERQRDHVKKLEETARAELRTLLAKLIDAVGERDHGLEAEIIGQVMHLQRLAMERGELSIPPQELARFETENNDTCSALPEALAVGKVGAPVSTIKGAHFGAQTIVRGAPVAILATDASLFAVLGNVRSYVRKA